MKKCFEKIQEETFQINVLWVAINWKFRFLILNCANLVEYDRTMLDYHTVPSEGRGGITE